jgi:O-antigen/teichoic acid export membrane protein
MSAENNKRIAKNTMMLYIRMLLLMAVSLYTSRIVLNTLGIEDYGIYNIVGGVIILFSFFNNAMSNATMRFLSFELGKKDDYQLKRTFSMSVNVHLGIALLILVLAETIGLWFLNTHLNIPDERMRAANWVYQFSIATFIVNIVRVPYHSTIIAHEKMTFYAYLSIIEGLLKLGVVFLLQVFGFDKLIFYGFLILIVSLVTLLTYFIYCVKNFEASHYDFFWDSKLFNRLISFSGWTMFGSVANVGSAQGTNVLLNIFYGVTVNAAMGIANQVNNAINGFVQNFQTAFRPQIVKSYAEGDNRYLMQLIFQTSKFSFLLLYFISLPILLNTEIVLQLWLKNVPEHAVDFVRLILVYSLLESMSGPLWMTVQATGRIKSYQVFISFLILSNLWISYIFLKLGYNPNVVLWIRIAISFLSFVYRIAYLKKAVALPLKQFLTDVPLNILMVIIISFSIPFFASYYFAAGITRFLATSGISILTAGSSIYFIGLKKNEKKHILLFLTKLIKKQHV